MGSNYQQILEDNLEEYGKGNRHLRFLESMYSDSTHFIYELLQNAEDARATKIYFELHNDNLHIKHDGRPFNEKDVRGICGIADGTKSNDLTSIGRFGIGFKSVYAYTTSPEIHSSDEHFKISQYIRPFSVKPIHFEEGISTLFIIPFDKLDIDPKIAFEKIAWRLANLGTTTLLFLKYLQEISYSIPSNKASASYTKKLNKSKLGRKVQVSGHNANEPFNEKWLIFDRPVQTSDPKIVLSVEIAFKLERDEKTNEDYIQKTSKSPLVVYFPTEKETNMGFLIQGPYRTTPARDNISQDDDWNSKLIIETAILLVDSLFKLKDMNLLTMGALSTLPIRQVDFYQDNMFSPVAVAVKNALIDHPLIPTFENCFVEGKNAKIARTAALRKLLNIHQAQSLFKEKQPIYWLSSDISENKNTDLYNFFTDNLKIKVVDNDDFVREIDKDFMDQQSDDWVILLYRFLSDIPDLWKRTPRDSFKRLFLKPIIRLSDNSNVAPYEYYNENAPLAFIGSSISPSFPMVKQIIQKDPDAYNFLKEIGLRELGEREEIASIIANNYRPNKQPESKELHLEHMSKFIKWFVDTKDLSPFKGAPLIFYEESNKSFMNQDKFYLGVCRT